jgi:hypothetical protein
MGLADRGCFGADLPVGGQPDVGREHKPECIVTYEWNIDKHGNEREEGDDQRYYVDAKEIEHPNGRNTHVTSLLKDFVRIRDRPLPKMTKQNAN